MALRSATAAAASERDIVSGMLIMASATMLLPVMDAFSKELGASLNPLQIAWGRFAFQALYTLPVVVFWLGAAHVLPRPLGLHVLRGILIGGSNVAYVAAIIRMPLATALATVFVWPLIVTAISALVLGEHVGPRRWVAVVVGLIGALIVIRPGSAEFSPAALLPVLCAIMFSGYFIVTRRLVGSAPAMSMHFFTGLSASLFLGLLMALAAWFDVALFAPAMPDGRQWLFLAIVGLISTAGHLLIILACTRAPASVLAPIGYLEIVGSATIGYLVFDEVPGVWTWVGVAVIIGSGLYLWMRERRVGTVGAISGRTTLKP
ncbi:EamA domain-containing membrane protein RarD [Tepidamorphus gemmatus]|jgi:drug/metabolite transporter (DMT)-like permease|uniref:EamA domain-containing membrane protein RarD n=1 Tax=Tepidamorphus gemmatus TaxID=747076 RepID=A0A4R3MEK2_9HYPH|nr:DMT family transporter [Tepidamorphus gemmatus]TCT09995.1 EamA domain-containing membrane protein RarD [Tepidamorphus gemmatus]